MTDSLPLFRPVVGVAELSAITEVFELGWLGQGSVTREFEVAVAEFLQVRDERQVVATSTGTAAIHLALLAAGVGPGDEVIVPSFNYVADHQAIVATGATPVFCDIDAVTLGVDVAKAADLVTARTKAILPLHYAGIPCDIEGVWDLASRRGLRVVEDGCHAFGTIVDGQRVGSRGDFTCFSFDPVKVVTTIDGGAVVVPDGDAYDRLSQLRVLGIDRRREERYENRRAWEWDVVSPGFRYHLSNVLSSIGLAQLRQVAEYIANRRRYCRAYSKLLADCPGVRVPQSDFEGVSPFIYYILVEPSIRGSLITRLADRGIHTTVHWNPVHRLKFFEGCPHGDLSVTEEVSRSVVTLPLHSEMKVEDIAWAAETIRETVRELL